MRLYSFIMEGREKETEILRSLLAGEESEFIVVTGRRRVGKTYLVKNVYEDNLAFDFTGTKDATKSNQLNKFAIKLSEYNGGKFEIRPPKNWDDAFELLKDYLSRLRRSKTKRKIIFFDEFPWIASPRSGFMNEFTYWWNDWATKQNIVVIICGSATSWMIQNVIEDDGGLHGRTTKQINLKPFTLAETKSFLESRKVNLDHYQLLQLYMSIGGVPLYLKQVMPGESATQNIDRICFDKDGILRHEFGNLYAALFKNHERYVEVIRILSQKWKGMTRKELSEKITIDDGGGLTDILGDLEQSSFIISTSPVDKKIKGTLYRLVDEYSLFYLKFIEGIPHQESGSWMSEYDGDTYRIWCGYAFENVCYRHIQAIKEAIGIDGIYSEIASYHHKGGNGIEGFQIDMLIKRADKVINICEIKYYSDDVIVDKRMTTTLRQRRSRFKQLTGTKHQVFNTIITTFGVKQGETNHGEVDQVITMDSLFTQKVF